MRNRHVPRMCRECQAPMANGAGTCWRCGIEWAPAVQPPARLRLVTSDVPIEPVIEPIAVAAAQAMP